MKAIQRTDVYVAILAGSLLGSAWLVLSGFRAQAQAAHMIAAAIDCNSEYVVQRSKALWDQCQSDADLRAVRAGH